MGDDRNDWGDSLIERSGVEKDYLKRMGLSRLYKALLSMIPYSRLAHGPKFSSFVLVPEEYRVRELCYQFAL